MYIIYSGPVSLFHSDETFRVYACTRSVFFLIRSIKKPVMFLKNGRKKLFSLQNVMKKLFEMHYSSEKNCLQVPKMVTLSPIKNSGRP